MNEKHYQLILFKHGAQVQQWLHVFLIQTVKKRLYLIRNSNKVRYIFDADKENIDRFFFFCFLFSLRTYYLIRNENVSSYSHCLFFYYRPRKLCVSFHFLFTVSRNLFFVLFGGTLFTLLNFLFAISVKIIFFFICH